MVSATTTSRRVLILTPHFPPDTSAATHRMRLIAPHLESFGWEPTILTVDEGAYESVLEPELLELLPRGLKIERAPAWSTATRRFRFGDLGLRAYRGMQRLAKRLFESDGFDAVVVTIYPTYTALLGPWLKRRYLVPFVLDYQDPWVGEWGRSAGPGKKGMPDLKSRLSRWLACRLEPRVVRAADALTAVSESTYQQVFERYPDLPRPPARAIPLGGEASDFDYLRAHPRENPYFDKADGRFHLCYVGTMLPLGYETLRALLEALSIVEAEAPELFRRVHLHFFGTSNQFGSEEPRVTPMAEELGVAHKLTEHPARIPYLDALTVQLDANGLILLGSSETHYTASKLYPSLLTGRPILACYHEESSVVSVARSMRGASEIFLVTYSDRERAGAKSSEIARGLMHLLRSSDGPAVSAPRGDELAEYSSRAMAERLADVLNLVVGDLAPAGGDGDVSDRLAGAMD